MLWVDYSTGVNLVRGGGSRGRDQETTAYQAGSKSRFLDNRLQVNASAFFYDYTNFNVSDVADPVEIWEDGEYVRYSPSGVGDAEIYGIDISSNFVITNVDRLNLAVSYLKADVAEVYVTYTNQAGGESPELPPFTIPSGLPLNNAPEWSVVANYQHRFDLANGAKITPNLTVRYTDEYLLAFQPDATNVPEGMDVDKVNTEPASVMGDFSMNYSHSTGKWSVNGYVKNITDHAQKTGFTRGDMRLGAPRTYGAVLSVNF
jgi:iron complex outermembrane receptor protein